MIENQPTSQTESPCIGTCLLNSSRMCIGCFRSSDEIGRWASASERERMRILDAARKRYQAQASAQQ